jgi:hypothetical protein
MKAPTSLLNRPGRAAAVVGAVLAVSASATVALVATASADEPGRCIKNVNIREKPDVDSRIVALCEAGTQVQVGETRDGFVHLTNLGGWSAQQYVAVNGRTPSAPAATEAGSRAGHGNRSDSGTGPDAGNRSGSGSRSGDEAGQGDASTPGSGNEETREEESGSGGGLGGLLG